MKRDAEDNSAQDTKKLKESPAEHVDLAHALGLSEFLSNDFDPLFGQIKNRIEDFLVTEVGPDGKDSSLTSFEIPEKPKRNENVQLVDLSEEIQVGLKELLSEDSKSYLIPAPDDKAERTRLHKTIATFSTSLSTETVKEGEAGFIKVTIKSKKFRGNRDNGFDDDSKFLHFTMLKWNIGTSDAIMRLANVMNINPRNMSYAGLKDKRGITSQRVSCKMLEPKRLTGLNKTFFNANPAGAKEVVYEKNFITGNFTFAKAPLKLGDVSGNKFCIALRECDTTTADNLAKLRTMLLEKGFINYFGMQRFGNAGNTNVIGRLILKKDYKSAIETILTANDNHKPDVVACLKHFKETGNANESFGKLKYKKSIEGNVLSALCKEPTNYKGALKSLHHKQQTLYAHAYQSYVWNKTVSKRIQKYGTQVLAGDLVSQDGDVKNVRQILETELSTASFCDVVLPLPGFDIKLPENECKIFLEEALQEDDMSLEDFGGPLGKEFDVGGAYRNLIYKPSEFSAEVVQYSEENEKLVATDLDNVLKISFQPAGVGEKVAILCRFTLPKSCYATMLLREISKGRI